MLTVGGKARQPWRPAATLAVAIGVALCVLLMSVAFGVSHHITQSLAKPQLRRTHLVNVGQIDAILVLLTVVITSGVLAETAAAVFILGVTVMRSRRDEIAIRRQSGVLRSTLLWEFVRTMMGPCIVGGVVGEVAGLASGLLLREFTVLPVRFTPVSVLAAFPVTIVLSLAATLVPAWRAANASPAILRRA